MEKTEKKAAGICLLQIAVISVFVFLSAVFLMILAPEKISALEADFEWAKNAGGTGTDVGSGIAADAAGSSYVTGYFNQTVTFGTTTLTSAGGNDIYVTKFDDKGNVIWAKSAGGIDDDSGSGIVVDASGNSYVTGRFRQTSTFGSNTLITAGNTDIFVAKYDVSGSVIWAKRSGGTGYDYGNEIAVDTAGNSYVTGCFENSVTFGATTLTSSGGCDIFVAKYDNGGNIVWAESAGGTGADRGYGIAIDNGGNSYVTGYFSQSANFGLDTLTSAGRDDIFVLKCGSSGNILWAKSAGGTGFDHGFAITADADGNNYVTGSFNQTITFGLSTLSSAGASDIFVTKYDTSGNVLWTKSAGGSSVDYAYGIAVDTAGYSYVTGHFYQTAMFGTKTLTSAGNNDIYVAKYDNGGNILSAKSAGGSGYDSGAAITVDPAGNGYITGFFSQTANFGSNTLTASAGTDMFVTRYSGISNITVIEPDGINDIITQGSNYSITWTDFDPNGSGDISLYYDTDDSGQDGALITSGISAGDENDFFAWDTTAIPLGDYYVYSILDDGVNPLAVDYGDGPVSILSQNTLIDYGDAPDPGYPTLRANTGAGHVIDNVTYLGTVIDPDADGQPETSALGDDNDGNDDEDGVNFTTSLLTGAQASVDVTVSATGYLNAWVDFNADGDWADQGEQIFVDSPLTAALHSLAFSVPADAVPGDTFARFRFSTSSGLTSQGLAIDGEVEDYSVTIGAHYDYGDAPDPGYPTLFANDGARHVIDNTTYLGSGLDLDSNGQPDANALGDDNDGNDDEDGVNFKILPVIGKQSTVDITASAPGILSAWLDYNADGDWADTGEQFFMDIPLVQGVNSPTFYVPSNAIEGKTFARFRFDSSGGLSYDGLALDGEVEDYKIELINHTITITEPNGIDDLISAGTDYTISWWDKDPDTDADISLYYDTDNAGQDGTLIVSGLSEDDTVDSYVWDTTTVPGGDYYIYGVIDDGINTPYVDYSSGTVTILAFCEMYLCNPGFEDGFDYWYTHGTPNNLISTDSVEGTNSLYSEHTRIAANVPSWSGVTQKMNSVEPAQIYTLSMWAKGMDTERGHVKIKWFDLLDNEIQVDYPIININGTIGWTSLSKLVTSPLGAVSAELYILHGINSSSQNVQGSTLWVDDITFDKATEGCGTLCNESFEHGTLYWIVNGPVGSHTIIIGESHEGNKMLESVQDYTAGSQTKWAGITQFAGVTESTTYRLRLWLKSLNVSTGHVKVKWRDEGGGLLSTEYPIIGINGTNSTWFKEEATLTSPISAAKAEISIWHGVTGGTTNVEGSTMWIDNITLICLSLCNGGFEDGNVHWETNGINEGEIVTTDLQEGTKAIKIAQSLDSSVNTQWAGISQRTLVAGDSNYNLSFWLKKENAVQGHVKVKWRDTYDNLISQQFPIGGINGTNLTWTQSSLTITAPQNAETIEIFIWHGVDVSNQNAMGSTLYLDNVIFVQVP